MTAKKLSEAKKRFVQDLNAKYPHWKEGEKRPEPTDQQIDPMLIEKVNEIKRRHSP